MRALSRKVAIENSLHKKVRDLKKINIEQKKTITHLVEDNTLLRKSQLFKRMMRLKRCQRNMKHHHKKYKENYKKALNKWKVQCSKLRKPIPVLEATGDILVQ